LDHYARERERGREEINCKPIEKKKKNSISQLAFQLSPPPTNSSVRAVRPRVAMAVRASVSTQQVRVE